MWAILGTQPWVDAGGNRSRPRSEALVHPPQALRHDGHQLKREVRRLPHEEQEALPIDANKPRVGPRHRVRFAGLVLDERHLPEDAARLHGFDSLATDDDVDGAADDREQEVAPVALVKDGLAGAKLLDVRIGVEKVDLNIPAAAAI